MMKRVLIKDLNITVGFTQYSENLASMSFKGSTSLLKDKRTIKIDDDIWTLGPMEMSKFLTGVVNVNLLRKEEPAL